MEDSEVATQQRIHAAASIIGHTVFESGSDGSNHTDCAVQSSITFSLSIQEPETPISRWARARIRAAKVGKGLSKNKKIKKLLLAYKYWVEAVDPLHRYANNLHPYYAAWSNSQSSQPFFYWLDFGDGKEVTLEECPRTDLQHQCVEYLGPKERETYEVVIDNGSGKLVYRHSGILVDTPKGTKWIFVLSTSRVLYVGEKKKGFFQHSSFVAGGAVIAAGRIVICNGVLQAMWAYSGHYRPIEDNLLELISFFKDHHVDLSLVETVPIDDDILPSRAQDQTPQIAKITVDCLHESDEEGKGECGEYKVKNSKCINILLGGV